MKVAAMLMKLKSRVNITIKEQLSSNFGSRLFKTISRHRYVKLIKTTFKTLNQ